MCLYPIVVKNRSSKRSESSFTVGCGHCVECLMKKSHEWAIRCMCEASLYRDNCFITLTYSDKYVPAGGNLDKRALTLFMKRLRERISPHKIRYFACGEYGSKFGRLHFHILVFGWKPPDLVFLKKTKRGELLFTSRFLESIWTYGFCPVGDITFQSALYSAKYLQKLQKVPYDVKPYTVMSRRPGIGFSYADNLDGSDDFIYFSGRRVRLPRYFLDVLDKKGIDLSDIRFNRQVSSLLHAVDDSSILFRRDKIQELFGTTTDF